MSEIDVKIDTLSSAITKLTEVKSQCECGNCQLPLTVGGGKTVNELEEIGKLYESMNKHLSTLVTSTILFLMKTKDAFEQDDKIAASKIKK